MTKATEMVGHVCTKCWRLRPCAVHPVIPFATARRSTDLYNSPRWKRDRALHLAKHPKCHCGAKATVVDHDPPHRGDESAFWDRSRFNSLCWPHSNQKTGQETHAPGRRAS